MKIEDHLDKSNLHHAYLIEGEREGIMVEVTKFVGRLGINTVGSSDFTCVSFDSLRIEDARNLKSYGSQKGFSSSKKFL
jgi:hypothetical protein